MKEESGHIIYTHQYLTGKLTDIEMHAMEKAALNDPMLADAIDGFAASASLKTEEGFSLLQNDLDNLRKKVGANSGNIKDNNWWKMAAAAIILLGTCFTFYIITNHTDKQKEAGIVEQTIVKAPAKKDALISADLKTDNTSVPAIAKEEKKIVPDKKKTDKRPVNISSNTFAANEPAPASASAVMDESISEEKRSAPIENSPKPSFSTNRILFKKDIFDTTGPRSHVEILYKKNATPIIGWSAYLNYLESQLSYSTYDNGKQVSGEMIIQFTIDSTLNVVPTEFYFEKSIDADVNNAVKELIQKNNQWKTDNNSQGIVKLKITF
jgi:hypothetical protein